MSAYRQVLVAVDLTDGSRTIAARSVELAAPWHAQLHLLHVVEYLPVEPMSDALVPMAQVDDRLVGRALAQVHALGEALAIEPACCHVATGNVKAEILRKARELAVDLIVLGCRERHGLSILVNLTEDTVLHGAPCDVLAMRVR